MRIFALVIGSLLLILGVGTYLKVSKQWRVAGAPVVIREATGNFQVELTPTFEAKVGEWSRFRPLTAELLINGRSVWSTIETLPAGQVIRVNPGTVFIPGENELWFAFYSELAAPGDDFGVRETWEGSSGGVAAASQEPASVEFREGVSRGVRLRIFRDGQVILDQTLWSVMGGSPGGIIQFQLEGDAAASPVIRGQNESRGGERTEAAHDVTSDLQGTLS